MKSPTSEGPWDFLQKVHHVSRTESMTSRGHLSHHRNLGRASMGQLFESQRLNFEELGIPSGYGHVYGETKQGSQRLLIDHGKLKGERKRAKYPGFRVTK